MERGLQSHHDALVHSRYSRASGRLVARWCANLIYMNECVHARSASLVLSSSGNRLPMAMYAAASGPVVHDQ